MWYHRYIKIRYGDYDIIEIRNSNEIEDYDFAILKVFTFFNNEIDRYKPIKLTKIRIVDNPLIPDNTMHLLHNNFERVVHVNS